MASLYSGLNTARSGLMAGQTALDVTAHNISNAATVGYSRQTVDLQNVAPNSGGYTFKPVGAYVGNGVDSSNVTQARDIFLDGRYRDANTQYSDYDQRSQLLSQVENIFNEIPSDSSDDLVGLSGSLSTLVSTFSKYQTPPFDPTLDANVQSAAEQLVSKIKSDYNDLTSFESSELGALQTIVTGSADGSVTDGGINGILKQISSLNSQISGLELSGNKANDLRDQRNNLLDKLSGYVDISAVEQPDGQVTVKITGDTSGGYLVDKDNHYHTLTVTPAAADPSSDADPDYHLVWDPNGKYNTGADNATGTYVDETDSEGKAVFVSGGQVNAYLNVLDGDGSGSATGYGEVGVVYLKQRLNDFAKTFANAMNSVVMQYQGTTVDAAGLESAAGNSDMLINYDTTAGGASAAQSIQLSSSWTGETHSTYFSDVFSATKETGDNADADLSDYAQSFTDAFAKTKLTSTLSGAYTAGTLQDYADTFSSSVANVKQNADSFSSSFEKDADDLDTQRQAVSSVSIDEESVNMIKYQQAYAASARVITTINDMLATLLGMAQ